MREVKEIKGTLHLYGISVFVEADMICDLYDNGIDFRFYCVEKGGIIEDMETKINYADFLEKYQGKDVRVQGGVRIHSENLEEGE